jgi:formylglycine-generating enzyme required for sulfatase activity
VDQRADIFSVCVILYELLTGALPMGKFKTPSELRDEIPKDADRIILKSLESSPEDRYATVRELLNEISFIGVELRLERKQTRFRISPRIAALLIAVAAASAIALLVFLYVIPSGLWWTPAEEQEAYAHRGKQPLYIENSVGMKLVLIPPGTFTMGSPTTEKYRNSDEAQHGVTLTNGFYMASTEVTNGQYRTFKPNHTSKDYKGHSLNGDEQPVVYVSWNDAVAFCDWLTSRERGAGKIGSRDSYRLPTEAEWEYACRAGTGTSRFWGDSDHAAKEYCNAYDPLAKREFGLEWDCFPNEDGYRVTAPAGRFEPNAYGLCDMIGNVWEWCRDWYGKAYSGGSVTDPEGPGSGSRRVLRGGSWFDGPGGCRSANRGDFRFVCKIEFDREAMRRYNVSLDVVLRAIDHFKFDIRARTIKANRVEYVICGPEFAEKLMDLENVVISTNFGQAVYLREVASVTVEPLLRRNDLGFRVVLVQSNSRTP